MPSIKCPHCNHKPFRGNNGLKWHLEHIHGTTNNSVILKQELVALFEKHRNKQAMKKVTEIDEKVNSRFDIFLRRDCWLSDRISELERNVKNHRTAKANCGNLNPMSCQPILK